MLDPHLPIPLYQQVMTHIRDNITSGRWQVPRQIPSERELCTLLGVSRTTVRQAMSEAVRSGLLQRVQGKGTFVARSRVQQRLVKFTGFEETIRRLNLEPSLEVLDDGTAVVAEQPARSLQVPPGSPVWHFCLLGLGSGQPMVVYDSYLPPDVGLQVRAELRRQQFRLTLIGECVARIHGWPFMQADQTFEAAGADAETARLLGTRRGAPVLQVTALFQNPQGRPVEYRRAAYRSDRYQFHVTRRVEFDA